MYHQSTDGHFVKDAIRDEGDRMLKVRTNYRAQTPYIRHTYETIGDSLYQDHLNRERRTSIIQKCLEIRQQTMSSQYRAKNAEIELTRMRENALEGIVQSTLSKESTDKKHHSKDFVDKE